jgi:transcriptional regulator with XRE-family HTH domain
MPRYRSLEEFFRRSQKSQEEIAAKVKITPSHMSMVVTGKRNPSLRLALALEAATGVPVKTMSAKRV